MKHKRPVSVIVILALLQLIVSCSIHAHRMIRGAPEKIRAKVSNHSIIRVQMKSGETIEFSKEKPGYISEDKIFWATPEMMSVKIKGKLTISKDDDTYVIKTVSGETYRCRAYQITDGYSKLVMELEQPKSPIPLSEVDKIWTRQANTVLSVLAILGGIGLLFLILDDNEGEYWRIG